MSLEKTGFESHQELLLSDKDVMIIIDSLKLSIRTLERGREACGGLLTAEVELGLLERIYKIQQIIDKLNIK